MQHGTHDIEGIRADVRHGAAETGLSMAVRDDPDNASARLQSRLRQLRDDMTATVTAMARTARG